MRALLEKNGINGDHFDSIVNDAAAQLASGTNEGGLKDQLRFLETTCGWSEERIMKALLMEQLEEGMTVEVSEPKHEVSQHTCSFEGMVAGVEVEYVSVRDGDDNYWDVSFDEIIAWSE